MSKIYISIIIPLLNEEDNIRPLYNKIIKSINKNYKNRFEIIFIDDGSTDNTFENLKKLYKLNKNIQIIKFYKNFGKTAALSSGFDKASGKIIITMDADLQDDPNEIPKFIKKIEQGYDLVVGWKYKRKDPLSKTLPSKLANFVTSLTTGLKIHDMNCGFKAYRRKVAKSIKLYGDMHRYIPALVHNKGYKITEIKVLHHKRMFGKSKYGFSRLFTGLFDFITIKFINDYIKRPMHFFGTIGSISIVTGFSILLHLSFIRLFKNELIGDRPLLLLGILLLILGFQFFSIGLIGETIINMNQKREDNYNIETILK